MNRPKPMRRRAGLGRGADRAQGGKLGNLSKIKKLPANK